MVIVPRYETCLSHTGVYNVHDQMFSIESMDKLRIVPAADYSGEGISKNLARGLLVWYGDCNLTGEGMGIGSVALRQEECTFFSRSWTDYQDTEIFRRTFTLDTCMKWRLREELSPLLTSWIEMGISAYMRFPRLQNLVMLPMLPLRRLFGIHPSFEMIPPLGKVTFTYRVKGHGVDVAVESDILSKTGGHLCLLNELSAAWFTHGWDGKPAPPPPGWEPVGSGNLPVSLIDPVHAIRFFLDPPIVPPHVPFTVFRGREYTGDLCWAGFCIEVGPSGDSKRYPEVRYHIGFASGEGT